MDISDKLSSVNHHQINMYEVDEKLIQSSEDKDRMNCLGAALHLKIKEETQSDVTVDEKRLDQLPLQRTIQFKSEPDVEEFVIKHETDDVQLENEELVIKNEDEVGIDRHTVKTKFGRHNIALDEELSEVSPNLASNHRGNLKHVQGPEAVQIFKCNDCDYQSIRKDTLQIHLLVHKLPSQLKMFQCTECSFQCKRKSSLQIHLVTHKDPMFRCNICSFETRYKKTIKRHAKVHDDESHIRTFKCDECSYEGKHLTFLRTHQQMHRNLSIHMLKCDKCSYFCKSKFSFERHQKTHANLS